ncbi:MAG: NAD(P)H-hydrate dehydratase [Coriobacteriia bacterium]|nr:NAD(P)H-hydrate dehydratase [Coriobacteriia bacterium]
MNKPFENIDLASVPEDANKYSRGKCNIVAGSEKYPGAAILCARASERCGSGYTQVYTHPDNVKAIAVAVPTVPVADFNELSNELNIDTYIDTNIEAKSNSKKPLSYVIGPGFYQPDYVEDVLKTTHETSIPVVVDGGAISKQKYNSNCVLTPHMGEGRRLADAYGISHDVTGGELADQLSHTTGACIVLKGPDTLIVQGDKKFLMTDGTPALAKAGTGDVLAGIIGSLCLRYSVFEAAVIGTQIHALAGKIVAKKFGDQSVIATDVIDALPEALSKYSDIPSAQV